MDRTPMINVACRGGGPMALELCIMGTRGAFLGALARHDERGPLEEPVLIADCRRENVDLERRAAPAHAEIRAGLREQATRAARAISTGIAEPIGRLEPDRRGRRIVPVELAREPAFAPRKIDGNAEMCGDGADIPGGAGPIHEARALAIDIMVVELDVVRRHAEVEQMQQRGEAVLSAAERDDDAPVGAEVRDGEHGHAASRLCSSGCSPSARPVARSRKPAAASALAAAVITARLSRLNTFNHELM